MKLDYKKTMLVGFAFFLILSFWQAYDTIVPLILTNKFNLKQTWSGVIMAMDNVLATFMLPLFGNLSDKTKTKLGKRTPFILFGTICSAVVFGFLGLVNNLVVFIILLLLNLIAMATFRSPAVALMPDVTIKPLRSKANAIINLMGTLGGIIILLFATIFKTGVAGKTDFAGYMFATSGVMVVALIVFMLTVRENKWVKEREDNEVLYGLVDAEEPEEQDAPTQKLGGAKLRSLILILASVGLWYTGYNAVTSKYSVYASAFLNIDYSTTLLIANAAAVVSYIPAGMITSKFGRKKVVIAGVIMLTTAFTCASFIRVGTAPIIMTLLFILAGIGWAVINVNSFPMAVELAKGSDVGKYTGYYYTVSMAAQVITPVLSGFLMDAFGSIWNLSRPAYEVLFPYSAIFVALAIVTMAFVKHGDSKPIAKKGLEALDVQD